jgi:hypothetical protein
MMRAILFTLSTLIAAAVPAAAQEMLDGTAIEHHIDLHGMKSALQRCRSGT